ncbi:23S rRNA (uracil(1939)-C(5))-methyltransferase RlmD [bacterium]|nr:23S rRNA (uracil(1939)-C(5))-methyltransferase RlmD [bacterium]
MLNVGDKFELNIEKLVYEGYGLGHKDGFAVFVDGACDGDFAEVKITKIKKNYANAVIEKIITPSPYRVKPFCPVYNACGGCQWQHIDYSHQLEIKQNIVREILSKALDYDVEVKKTMPSPLTKEFRHKVQMPVSQTKNSKRFLIGYYKKGSHEIINNKFCPIQPPILSNILNMIREKAQILNVTAYNESKHKGELRHILFRVSQYNEKILLCFVANNNKLSPEIKNLACEVFDSFEQITGVSVNFNTEKNNVILGKITKNITGDETYEEKIGEITYVISPESFFQINPLSFKNILEKVKELIINKSEKAVPTILDAYSGVGSFGLYLSDVAKKITCVEEIESACKNAQKACKINNIKNIDVINGDAKKIFEKLIKENKTFDFVILDPPRKGCSIEALDYCAKLADKYIVYVSCNPHSLSRDLKHLKQYGFKLLFAQTADMFCHTYHVETITLLSKE